MRRIRQWQKVGAGVGLFALVLQLWLSFGHTHAEAGAPAQIETAALSTSNDHDDGEATLHRDLCAICVTAQLLSSSFAPAVPAAAYVPAFGAIDPAPFAVERTTGTTPPRAFLARAPPRLIASV